MKESVEQSSKRPEFLKNRRAPQIPAQQLQVEFEPAYINEESVKISFVQDQINKIDFKTTLDMQYASPSPQPIANPIR